MEEAVPQSIYFEIVQSRGRILVTGHHMVPLKNLVKNVAVEEPAEAKPPTTRQLKQENLGLPLNAPCCLFRLSLH